MEKGKAVIKTSGKDNKPELICKISNICGTYHRPQCPYRTRNMPWILQFETIWDKTGSSNCTNQHNLNHQPNSLKGEYFTYQSGHRIWLQKVCYTSWSLSFKPTSHHIRGHVWRHFEVISGTASIPVNQEKTGNKKILKEHLFGREEGEL